jgi:hypothetical protein
MIEFYQELWSSGVDLILEGANIRIKGLSKLSSSQLTQLKNHKQEMIELLRMDHKAKEAGFLIMENGAAYLHQYSKTGFIFVVKDGDKWNAWRETWSNTGSATGVIVSNATFDLALLKAKQRYDYITGKEKENVS